MTAYLCNWRFLFFFSFLLFIFAASSQAFSYSRSVWWRRWRLCVCVCGWIAASKIASKQNAVFSSTLICFFAVLRLHRLSTHFHHICNAFHSRIVEFCVGGCLHLIFFSPWIHCFISLKLIFFSFVSLVSIFLVNVSRCRAFEHSPCIQCTHSHTYGTAQSVNEHTRLWIFSSAKWISDFWIKTKGFYIHTNNMRFFFAFLFWFGGTVCARTAATHTMECKNNKIWRRRNVSAVKWRALLLAYFSVCSFQHECNVYGEYIPICLHQMMTKDSTSNALIAVSLSLSFSRPVSVFYCSGHSSFQTWAGKKAKEHAIKDNSQFSNLHRLIVISDF